jgi:transposase
MPGVGTRAARLLRTVGDGSSCLSARHVAAYTGLAPTTRQSSRSIKGRHQTRAAKRRLRGAPYISAFASLKPPPSRAYYDRKRAAGKSHTAPDLPRARQRVDVLHAMIRD